MSIENVARSTLTNAAIQQEYAVSNCDYDTFFVCTDIVDNFVKNDAATRLTVGVQRLFVKMPKHWAVAIFRRIKHLASSSSTLLGSYPPFARHPIFVHKSSGVATISQRRRQIFGQEQAREG